MVELVRDSYVGVLFDLAKEENRQEEIGTQIQEIREIIELNPEFFVFLTSPQITKEERIQSIDKILGGKVDDTLLRFMKVLIHNRRMDYLLEIAKKYQEELRAFKGIIYVEALTAVPLDEDQREKLENRLVERLGKQIELKNIVDPDILGGMKLKIGEKSLDATLKSRLRELQSVISKF